MAKPLDDIGKDAKDLLTEGYPIDGTVKVAVQTRALGFIPKVTLIRALKREKSATREVVSAVFEPKYEWKEQNLEFTSKFSTTSELSGGVSAKDIFTTGTKVDIIANRNERDGLSGVFGGAYRNDSVSFKGKLSYPFAPKKPIKANVEGVFQVVDNTNVGVGVDVTLEGETARIKTDAVVAYTTKENQFKGLLRYDVYESSILWGLSYFQRINPRTNWALDITSESATDGPVKTAFSVGSDHKVDDFTSLKGKWVLKQNDKGTDYRFGVALRQKVTPFVTAIFGADLNPRNFLGSTEGEAHSFGFELKLQD
jgi:hypothetical protein